MVACRSRSRGGTRNHQAPGVVMGRAGRYGPARSASCEIPYHTLRIGTLNVGTMKGRSSEVVETATRRQMDMCCLQEVRWRGGSARMITGKDSRYKFYWMGSQAGTGGVGILLAEKWVDKVFDVIRVSDRILVLKVCLGKTILNVLSIYAPQVGLDASVKEDFYDQLQSVVSKVSPMETLAICGDFNGHIGRDSDGFEGVHGGHGLGERNQEGERILEFATAHDLVVGNSFFRKSEEHMVTYQSGGHRSQIDYFLLRKSDLKHARNIKVIAGEECATQHRLLVCDLLLQYQPPRRHPYTPKLRTWKLRDPLHKSQFSKALDAKLSNTTKTVSMEDAWSLLKSSLQQATEQVCGWTKKGPPRKQTWWWNGEVNAAIQKKRKCFKEWRKGGSKEPYLVAKREAKQAVHLAKKTAEERELQNVKDGKDNIFRIAKQMKRENQDVIGEKCIRDDDGVMALDDESKKTAWKQHYERLLNVEFPWNPDHLSPAHPVSGAPVQITEKMVQESIKRMKVGKAAGPSGIVAEMLKASGEKCFGLITELMNHIIKEGCTPGDWNESFIVNCYKGKGDALERGNYRGLKLLDQVMKVMERIIERLIRAVVNINEMQFGFMPGRGTIDAIFIVRQLQEQYLLKNRQLYFAFVDLEKAFDRVPRQVLWWALRKTGVEEWLVRVVQTMYHNATSKVRIGSTYSDSVKVDVGVHQGSVLSPLLFVIVLEALSREFGMKSPWELLYADDLVIIADNVEELKARLNIWKSSMESKGLRVNMGKTKILCSGKNMNILKDKGKWPCSVCRKGVGQNSIYCASCSHWVHKACSGIQGRLREDPSYRCPRCRGLARQIDGRPFNHVTIDGQDLEVIDNFCYLGDTISAEGDCLPSVTKRCRAAWGKFRELLPILTCRTLSIKTRGHIYASCVRGVLLYASECWAIRNEERTRLLRNERAMARWICGVNTQDQVDITTLYSRLGIVHLDIILRRNRLRWYGHTCRSVAWIHKCQTLEVQGCRGRGRPRKTWMEVIKEDLRSCNLTANMAQDRDVWREKVRATT